ncbi:hypothetical protein [Pseudomonas sp. DWP3-1-2]|uniref:hypothetical protein n=1 Tax=Pseudomonas sp. DWP3-1-2 TaxID=2804645 RepID=UPI003CF7363F
MIDMKFVKSLTHVVRVSTQKFIAKLLTRNPAPINSRFEALSRPLYKQKCDADLRYAGLLMDRSQPVLVTESDLAPADVLFCVGDSSDLAWSAISFGSSGDYVHAAVYVGNGYVVESTLKGVNRVPLTELIARYRYVVASRCPGASPDGLPELSSKVVDFCSRHVDLNTPYNKAGALKAPLLEYQMLRHINRTFRTHVPVIKKKAADSFFCSELIVGAFVFGGYVPEGTLDPAGYSPTALAESQIVGLVGYLSSPEMADYILDNDYFLTGGIPRRKIT